MPVKPMSREQMISYLQENVYRDGECLTWAGPVSVNGNPKIQWHRKAYLARRLLLELADQAPGNKKVTETCGNKLCMNKDHLLVLTHRQAIKKASKEGKLTVGAQRALKSAIGKAKGAKLPITEARNVMAMRAQGVKVKDICAMYGVGYNHLNRSEKTWRRVGII